MKKIFLVLLLCSALAYSVNIQFKDLSTGALLTNANVVLNFSDEQTSFEKTLHTSERGQVIVDVPQGTWALTAKSDLPETLGKDLLAEQSLNIQSNEDLIIFLGPTGSVQGEVLDAEGDYVSEATIQIDCLGKKQELSADQFGSFTANYLPVGSCKISALQGDNVGNEEVIIKKGELVSTQIALEKKLVSPWIKHPFRYFAIASAIALIEFIVLAYVFGKKYWEKIKPEPIVIEKISGDAFEDIMRTLGEREKKVVDHLLQNEGKSNQAKIFRETLIPKTSLIRTLQGLEKKSILKVEKHGKDVRVELKSWFLMKAPKA